MESLFCFRLENWENFGTFSTVKSTKISFLGENSREKKKTGKKKALNMMPQK
jgi:hypothetical protein